MNDSFRGSVRVIMYETAVELCPHILLLLPQVTRFTGATNGDCGKPTDSELMVNGMARATCTVTDGLTGSNNSPQTTTLVHIFTDATASQAIAMSCLVNTTTRGNANNVQLAAATFTAITLLLGDTLQMSAVLTLSTDIFKSLSASIQMGDVLKAGNSFALTLFTSLQTASSFAEQTSLFRSLSASIQIDSSLTRQVSLFRSLFAVIQIDSSFAEQHTAGRAFRDCKYSTASIVMNGALTRTVSAFRTLTASTDAKPIVSVSCTLSDVFEQTCVGAVFDLFDKAAIALAIIAEGMIGFLFWKMGWLLPRRRSNGWLKNGNGNRRNGNGKRRGRWL